MEGSHCQVCDELFPNADELKRHQEGLCSASTDVNIENDVNPIDNLTTDVPSSLEVAPDTPKPVEASTPMLCCSQTSTKSPEEISNEDKDSEPEVVIDSTQDVINYIAGNDLSGTKTASTKIPDTGIESMPDDASSQATDVATEVEEIIAGFCVDAPSDKVRDILRLYSPENSYEKQKGIFDSRSKKDDLVKTLEFLGESCSSWKDVKKKDCAHKLLYRIQNLMPEECGVCKEKYVVKVTDPRLLSCSICGQEVHHQCYESLFVKNDQGLSMVETWKKKPGFHHLCPSCEIDTIPDEKLTSVSSNDLPRYEEEKPQHHPMHHSQHPPQQKQELPRRKQPQSQTQLKQQQQQQEIPSNPSTNENDDSPPPQLPEPEEVEDKDITSNTQTCRHYKNNTCRFGISGKGCPFVHPKRCSKLMNHGTRAGKGCNKGNKCNDFHPKMCPLSISKSECLDISCTLCHVKGTRRKPKSTQPKKVESTKVEDDDNSSNESSTKKTTRKNDSPNDKSTPIDNKESFLDQIHLLKKELQEAMDKKLESLIQMQSQQATQQIPPFPFRPTPTTQPMFSPIPWMHQFYQMQRNPLFPMGY